MLTTRHDYERWEELTIQREHTSLLTKGNQRLAILQGGVEVMAARMEDQSGGMAWELSRLNEQLRRNDAAATVGHAEMTAGMADIRAELSAGFQGLDTMFASLETVVQDGLAQVAAILTEMNRKLDWSDEYRRFLSFKRNAFELTLGGDPLRAIKQGVAGLTLRDSRGAADDRIERDPELSALVAQLVLFHQPADYDGPAIEVLAENARRRGAMVGTSAALAAAAGGCQLLAIAARARGDGSASADLEWEGVVFEPGDQVAAVARMYAADLWVSDPDEVAFRLAVFSVLFARFFAIWLLEPATLARRAMVTDVGKRAAATLIEWDGQLREAALARRAFWREAAPSVASQAAAFGEAPLQIATNLPMSDLAASVRARMRALMARDAELGRLLASASRDRSYKLGNVMDQVATRARENWQPTAAALEQDSRAARADLHRLNTAWLVTAARKARAVQEVERAEGAEKARAAGFETSVARARAATEVTRQRLAELARILDKPPLVLPPQLASWPARADLRNVRTPDDLEAICDAVPAAWRATPVGWDNAVREAAALLAWTPTVER